MNEEENSSQLTEMSWPSLGTPSFLFPILPSDIISEGDNTKRGAGTRVRRTQPTTKIIIITTGDVIETNEQKKKKNIHWLNMIRSMI